jgi:predicted RNase H-like nuclease (RuvC/YqgF family)
LIKDKSLELENKRLKETVEAQENEISDLQQINEQKNAEIYELKDRNSISIEIKVEEIMPIEKKKRTHNDTNPKKVLTKERKEQMTTLNKTQSEAVSMTKIYTNVKNGESTGVLQASIDDYPWPEDKIQFLQSKVLNKTTAIKPIKKKKKTRTFTKELKILLRSLIMTPLIKIPLKTSGWVHCEHSQFYFLKQLLAESLK